MSPITFINSNIQAYIQTQPDSYLPTHKVPFHWPYFETCVNSHQIGDKTIIFERHKGDKCPRVIYHLFSFFKLSGFSLANLPPAPTRWYISIFTGADVLMITIYNSSIAIKMAWYDWKIIYQRDVDTELKNVFKNDYSNQ